MLGSIGLFALGSALAGAAQNMTMLIAARSEWSLTLTEYEITIYAAIQGIGGGGITNLCEIIVSDLVSLAERGLYQGILGLTWSFASGVGPPIVRGSRLSLFH